MQRTKSKYNIMTLSCIKHTSEQLQPHEQQYIYLQSNGQTSKCLDKHNQCENYSDIEGQIMSSGQIIVDSLKMDEQHQDQFYHEEKDKEPIYKTNGKHKHIVINQLNGNKQNIGSYIKKISISKYLTSIEQNCQKEPFSKNKKYVNMKVNLSDSHRLCKYSKPFVIINKQCQNQTFNPQQQQSLREQLHQRYSNNQIKLVYVHLSTYMRDNIFYQIQSINLNIQLGTIIVQQQKLQLNYKMPQHTISRVLLTNQFIQISINQNIYRYIYRHNFMDAQPTPSCINNIIDYCVWILDQIRLYQVKQRIEDSNADQQIVFDKYFKYQCKQIQVQLMKSPQNKIRAAITIHDENTTDIKKQKLQFTDIDKMLAKHIEQYLVDMMGETIYKNIVKIYSNYWYQYVSDL